MKFQKNGLTIAGSDSSGGAGIQADIKSFSANGVFGMSVITSVTAQNTAGVTDVEDLSPRIIESQIRAIFDDIKVDCVKIGMVSNKAAVDTIASVLSHIKGIVRDFPPVVVDPVMVSTSGSRLLKEDAMEALVSRLIPLSDIVTPNIPEAEVLAGMDIDTVEDMKTAASKIKEFGAGYVLVKGGHLEGKAIDILYDGDSYTEFSSDKIESTSTHGTGCTLSSAIAANLAKGCGMEEAVESAKRYVTGAIENGLDIGSGNGPTNHFYLLD